MAGKQPKKEKQEQTSQLRRLPQSMSQNPSQIVPFPGHSPIQITNRFSTLGSTTQSIRPNYQSALVSQYDPFQLPLAQSTQSSHHYPKSSPYQFRSQQNLFTIEPIYSNLSDPAAIARDYFPPRFHFLPLHPQKDLQFYKLILVETQSIEIKPIKDKNDPCLILFHSLYIRKILSQSEWGDHPFSFRTLSSKVQYNYYDYIQAWTKIFLHQHIDFSHSWFINFDSKFNRIMPYWFRNWWDTHGPTNDLLPLELNQIFTYFVTKYRIKQEEQFFPTLMIFISKYKIPWILKWSYGINSNTRILTRIYNVKWWDKFLISKIIGHVYTEFPISPSQQKPPTSGASQASLQIEGKSSS